MACRIDESPVAKAATASRQTAPPIISVTGVPTKPAMKPNNKLPNDSMLRRAITNRLSTRPRFWSSTMLCTMVLLDAICIIKEKPSTTAMTKAIDTRFENAKASKPAP